MVLPDGSGTPFSVARLPYGTLDGTITLRLIDLNNDPVPNMPSENLWLQVNLSDFAVFAGDYFDTYNFRSDFNGDGVVNLSGLPPMVVAVGTTCP